MMWDEMRRQQERNTENNRWPDSSEGQEEPQSAREEEDQRGTRKEEHNNTYSMYC